MYLKSINFSNKYLRIYYKWVPEFLNRVEEEEKLLWETIEEIKETLSKYYNTAIIKRSLLNELQAKILQETSNTVKFYSPNSEEFMEYYKIRPVCEGCKKEPIQNNAHIIKKSREKNLKFPVKYLDHCANLWF